MEQLVSSISSTQEVAMYWRSCLVEFSTVGERDVVLSMLSISQSDYFIDLYDSEENPAITKIFNDLAELDQPDLDIETRGNLWELVRNQMHGLES